MAILRIDEDGVKHLQGCSRNCFETLCGNCDTGTKYETDVGTPDCSCCITAAKEFFKLCTATEVKKWRD